MGDNKEKKPAHHSWSDSNARKENLEHYYKERSNPSVEN